MKKGFTTSSIVATVKKLLQKNKKLSAIVLVLLFVAVYGIYNLTQGPKATAGQIAQAEVTRGPIEVTVTGTGTIVPVESEDIAPGVSGTIEKIYVKNGDKVKKGDLLMEIKNDSLNLDLANARLDLEEAALNLDNSSGSGSMTAPFSGRIVSLEVRTGDDVTKNTVLATLQDDSQLIFNMPVDPAAANKVSVNQKVEVFLPDRGESVEGRVIYKSSQSVSGYNGQNRVYLKVALSATGTLSPGMKAFGTLTIDGKEVDALAVSTLEWIQETQLKATLTGKITGIYVEEGQSVKKGQKLFAIDGTERKAQELAYKQAQLNLTDLESRVADLTVKAPIDGIVSGMEVKEGDDIGTVSSAGSSAKSTQTQSSANSTSASTENSLGKIINTSQMKVSFPVDEVDIAKVKIGQEASISADALPEQVFKGKVTEISEEGVVTNNVSSFEVTIMVDNPDKLLKSGMTANVIIIVARKDNAVLIPIEALQETGNRKFVLLPSEDESDPGRNRQPVTVGLTNESYAEIIAGLKEGDKILLPGLATNGSARPNGMMPGLGDGRNPAGGGGFRIRSGGSAPGGVFRSRN